jgi:FkbM family methyltransferase
MNAEPLVFDIGFHDGSDTEYYLSKGMKVVAVEANPDFVTAGNRRLAAVVESGRLVLHHAAVVARADQTSIKLYVNHRDSGSSSLQAGWRGDDSHAVDVPCITLAELMKKHGVPWYLKIDIEGMDEEIVQTLPRESRPMYLSCEVSFPGKTLEILESFGYTDFKLLNQDTFTQSTAIADSEIGLRALRKMSTVFPPVGRMIQSFPDVLRPSRIEWDSFRDRFPYVFPEYSSGPCGEDTFGPWRSATYIRRLSQRIGQGEHTRTWFDLHARLPKGA